MARKVFRPLVASDLRGEPPAVSDLSDAMKALRDRNMMAGA